MRREVVIGIALVVPVLFFADSVNRQQVGRVLENMAAGKAPMEKVAFVFPLVPHPTPKPTPAPLYPDSVLFGEDMVLKYEDLGAGYWQSGGFNMVSGEGTSGEQDWQAHFRFKFNPPHDPLHPGHSIVAIPGGRSKVRFAKLGDGDFFGFKDLSRAPWIGVAPAETPAVWGITAGMTVAMRIDTDLSVPLQTATRPEPEGTPALNKPKAPPTPPPAPIKVNKLTFAKIFVRKVSHDTVRFDYVYQTDGKPLFPTPNPMAEVGM
ncbi:MAG: hypothetical protein FJZ01_00420 [Candidatus Sericytochromatia bacterium]|nr:hypothetical protein [Candidatus Tanganyikabacteria bacterium]